MQVKQQLIDLFFSNNPGVIHLQNIKTNAPVITIADNNLIWIVHQVQIIFA